MAAPAENIEFDFWRYLVDQAAGFGSVRQFVPYFVGESLAHPEILSLVSYAKGRLKCKTNIHTNGMYFRPELLSVLDELFLSLYGASDETYEKVTRRTHAWPRIYENILRWVEAGKKQPKCALAASYLITPENRGEMQQAKALCDQIGLRLYVSMENNLGFDPSRVRLDAHRGNCTQLYSHMCIHVNGDVVVCCGDHQHRHVVDNARERPLKDIWLERFAPWRRRFEENRLAICKQCAFRPCAPEANVSLV